MERVCLWKYTYKHLYIYRDTHIYTHSENEWTLFSFYINSVKVIIEMGHVEPRLTVAGAHCLPIRLSLTVDNRNTFL